MLSLNCIAKIAVCRSFVEKIGDASEDFHQNHDIFIKKVIKMHQSTLELAQATNSIFKHANMVQLSTALFFLALTIFQIKSERNFFYESIILLMLFQLLAYCFIGEWISTEVTKL